MNKPDQKEILESIMRHSQTEKGKRLKELLYNIRNNDLFVLGILLSLKTDEQKQLLIDELEAGNNWDTAPDTPTVSDLAFAIADGNWPVEE